MVKCFQTQNMPKNVYEFIAGFLHDDTGTFYVVDDNNPEHPDERVQWFINNGAEYGEKVVIERGTWL